MRILVPLAVLLALSACDKPMLVHDFRKTAPVFDPVAFWTGHHRSWGVIENRAGTPTDTVVTDCVGTPEGGEGLHMVQTLTLGDGTVQHRDWHLRRTGGGTYAATANDMVGEASGQAAGRAFHWSWVLATSPGNALKNVTMDQWMYLLDPAPGEAADGGGRMMNRTTIRKLGVILAEVSEEFQVAR